MVATDHAAGSYHVIPGLEKVHSEDPFHFQGFSGMLNPDCEAQRAAEPTLKLRNWSSL